MSTLRLAPLLIAVWLLLAPGQSYAAFGLGPCCSGVPCGIIPCDTGCAGQAITQMGSSVSAALSSLQSAYEQQTQATNEAQESVNSLTQNLVDVLNDTHQEQLRGLDAATSRIEASVSAFIPAHERLTDHKVSSMRTILQRYFVASRAADSAKSLGPMAQPVSGEFGPKRSAAMASLVARQDQIAARLVQDYYAFIGDDEIAASGSKSLLAESLDLDVESFGGAPALIHANVLSPEQEQFYQRLLAYMVSTTPARTPAGSPSSEIQELIDKRRAATNSMIFAALSAPLSARIATSERDWNGLYEDPETSLGGDVSLTETLRNDTTDRLTNAEYWGSVKKLTVAGLNRELVYLNTTSSVLRKLEYDLKQQAANMTALTLLSYVRK